ncbi:MAG: ion transporter [Abditibacteriota bacterium]|nr:ion transporter [Abditibacteriota bacterium]
MRKRLYEIIEVASAGDRTSAAYDLFMIFVILASVVPLTLKSPGPIFRVIEVVATLIFIADYIFRFITADLRLGKGARSFLIYPFTLWAIVDLISILPGVSTLNSGFRLFRLFRMFRVFRALRVAKAFRYSKTFEIIIDVIVRSRGPLGAVCALAVTYIIITALIVFCAEPQSFGNYFDALYWAAVTLTTVGYGDLYPVTAMGRVISIVSALFGIAVVALPAGIITAGYMQAMEERKNQPADDK